MDEFKIELQKLSDVIKQVNGLKRKLKKTVEELNYKNAKQNKPNTIDVSKYTCNNFTSINKRKRDINKNEEVLEALSTPKKKMYIIVSQKISPTVKKRISKYTCMLKSYTPNLPVIYEEEIDPDNK